MNDTKKEEILQLVMDHKDSFVQIIKSRYKDFHLYISENFIGKSFSEKLYLWSKKESEIDIGKCNLCKNNPVKFLTFNEGYRKYCSTKCANMASAPDRSGSKPRDLKYWEEKECILCKNKFWSLKFRNQVYCSNSCSAKSTANDVDRLNKIRITKLERYGNETYVNPQKAIETCMKRYGVSNASKAPGVIELIKQTNLDRFGKEWTFQSEDIKEKIKNTNLERYGVENPSQSNIIKDKRTQSFIRKYGVSNPFLSAKIMEDCKNKYKQKFGVEYPMQISEVREKMIDTVRKNNYKSLPIVQRGMSKVDLLFSEDEFIDFSYQNKYKVKCQKCGNIFHDHFDGNGHPRCLICYPNIAGFSISEKEIVEFIKSILGDNIEIICRDRTLVKPKEIDIYIPALKTAIEYNGLFWHSEVGGCKDKEYHINKLNQCNDKGVRLITIFEDEWDNKEDIVKTKLKHILGINNNDKVYARKCEINEISGKHSNMFFNKYHLQGTCISKINVGLFYNNDLVGIMTFGKPRISLGRTLEDCDDNEFELLRYATSNMIIGGAGKLFSYFVKKYSPKRIISYADRRWSNGNLYEKIGFINKTIIPPSFSYFKPGYAIRYHSFGFRKSVLFKKMDIFDPNLTGWENMQLNGYDRIWDCGNFKYEWKVS